MNRQDQDPHDWLTAQFSDDDDLDDENAGTDAADSDAADSTALTTPEPAVSASLPVASAPEPPVTDSASEPAASEPAESVASESAAAASEPMRGASPSVATTGAPFTWGLRPTASPAAPVEQPAPAAEAPPIEREPDPVVPASFFPAPTAARPTPQAADDPAAPSAADPAATAAAVSTPEPNGAAPQTAAPVSAAAAAAAPMSAAPSEAPTQPARPFYPPPPAISPTTQRGSEPLAVSAGQPVAEPTQADGATGPGISISEVLDAPSPRRAAREAAAREEAAREAATRDDIAPVDAGADEPQDDGIDDLVDPHAPFTPTFAVLPREVPGAAAPVRATGTPRFDVPVLPTADGPALVGRAQSVANREASMKASSSRTQKILLLVGIVLVVALGIVLIFVLAQRGDAATLTGALDAGAYFAEAVGLARSV